MMYYGKRVFFMQERKRRIRIFKISVALLLLLSILSLSIYSYLHVRRIIITYAESEAETIIFNIANRVIGQEVTDADISYNDIVNLSRDESGNVTSLEIDIEKINYLKSTISSKISEEVSRSGEYTLSIPVGNLIGNEYLLGLGPKFKFRMQATSSVTTDFESNFYSAGINQVLHQIVIKVKINGSLVLPWRTGGFSTETSIIAAQTVLVGVTPDAYTNVQETYNEQGMGSVGDIFDYGAELNN